MIQEILSQFLEQHCPGSLPLLLALSGGPDSTALFHALLELEYPFEVAHVDHGWREESVGEVALLRQKCVLSKVVFHEKKLVPPTDSNNLEDKARKERLSFFKQMVAQRNLGGVLLAHHADDHAETVLKRLFEGASLPKLRGLQPKSSNDGLILYRPFLKLKKQEILHYLELNNISFFVDRTNSDPKYLRTRLRGEIIPAMASHFGKEITHNLCRLGESAAELETFLEELSAPYLQKIEETDEGKCLNFKEPPSSLFLWKNIIRAFFEQEKLTLTNSTLEVILSHLQKGSCHKSLHVGKQRILINRRHLVLIRQSNKKVDAETKDPL